MTIFFSVQDDGASIHTAKIIKAYKDQNGMKTMSWPPKSPDLNIIENLWAILKHNIRKEVNNIETIEDLKAVIVKCWDNIPLSYVRSLYTSMPRRCRMVSVLKGHRTKY